MEHFDLWPCQCPPVPLPELAACHADDVGHLKGWPTRTSSGLRTVGSFRGVLGNGRSSKWMSRRLSIFLKKKRRADIRISTVPGSSFLSCSKYHWKRLTWVAPNRSGGLPKYSANCLTARM